MTLLFNTLGWPSPLEHDNLSRKFFGSVNKVFPLIDEAEVEFIHEELRSKRSSLISLPRQWLVLFNLLYAIALQQSFFQGVMPFNRSSEYYGRAQALGLDLCRHGETCIFSAQILGLSALWLAINDQVERCVKLICSNIYNDLITSIGLPRTV